jgi:hypothetical protein
VERSESASSFLLQDLRSDRGMKWLPTSGMWLTFLSLDAPAGNLLYDLALNVDGGAPSRVDAGLPPGSSAPDSGTPALAWVVLLGIALLLLMVFVGAMQRRAGAGGMPA